MKQYTYFPGCSCSEGGAKFYNLSAQAVARVFDTELVMLEDWNCCGSTPYGSVDELTSFCLTGRSLALAEAKGRDLVTPCSCCYVMLNRTNTYLKQYPKLKAKVGEALAAGNLEYHGTIRVRHLLDVLANDIGYEAVRAKTKRYLEGLKVAPYYGCMVVRPQPGFDHPESPQTLDKLIASMGGEPVPFPLKSRCCGGSLIIPEEDLALELVRKLLDCAVSNGAQCMVAVCPLCQMNLDAYQSQVNKKYKTNYKLPILFTTQLMGFALGLGEADMGFNTNIVSASGVLAKYR